MGKGRPRKSGKREANGRVQRPSRPDEREGIMGVALKKRESWVKRSQARDHRAGFAFGRARLLGLITETQYRAGAEFEACCTLYREVMGLARHSARTVNLDGTVRGKDGDFDPAHALAIKRRYNRSIDALKAAGWDMFHAVIHIVVDDKSVTDQNLLALREGCNVLAALSKAKGGKVLHWHADGAVACVDPEFWARAVAEYEREKAA